MRRASMAGSVAGFTDHLLHSLAFGSPDCRCLDGTPATTYHAADMPRLISHRRILGAVLVAAGLIVLGLGLARRFLEPAEPPAPRPIERRERSVLLITVDTTRADRLGPYGAENIETPTLDRLAAGGVTFERAYSVAPITLVAHTSILSGLDPPQHGVRNNGIHYVPDEVETLAERLQEEGYATAAFVSAAVLERRYNLDQGFQVYDDDLSEGRERHPRMVADRPAEFTVQRALAWLDGPDGPDDDQPYFLWVHFYDPHAAYSPPPPWRDTYRERLYDGEIAYMDAQMEALLRHPRVRDDAIVTVIGDHGESLGEHGEQTHALLAYDSTLHVPWILRVPDGPRGLRLAPVVGQVDLAPTLLDLLGLDPLSETAGRSLVPLLEGRHLTLDRGLYGETWLPYYTYGWAKLRVWRQGRYKWIDAPTPELYDLRRDPRELTNRAEQEPGTAHDLARDLAERLAALGDSDREAALALDSDAREKLRSLGYVAVGSGGDTSDAERPDPKAMIALHVGLERARFLARDRLYPQAEEELRRVLRRDATNLAAMTDLAQVLTEQEKLDEAVQVVERALDLDPAYARLHMTLAGLEARRGETDKALELYDSALELDPKSLEIRLQKAMFLQRQQRVQEAEALLEETLAEHPEAAAANILYAQVVEIRRGDLEAAEARLRRAIERDPFLVSGWRLLGDLLEGTGRVEEAMAAYREGLQRGVDDADLHAQMGIVLARQRGGAEAEVHLREALRLARNPRPEVRVALGAWLAEHRRFEEALAEYEAVLAQAPQHPGARNNRAIAFYQTGRLEAAEEELRTLVAQHPRHADGHNNLAAIALEQGRHADAERHARRTLELSPEMAEAWNNLGLALGPGERTQEARRAFERALALRQDYWQARLNLGLLLSRMEEWPAAATALQAVVRQVPQAADAHLELGLLYAGPLDDPERARVHLQAFLRHAPGHPRAREARQKLDTL
jgi:arylsulfatase A-like enzyme/Tfp pilus assembly protein PilF